MSIIAFLIILVKSDGTKSFELCRIMKVFEIANVVEFVFFTLVIASVGEECKIVFHYTFPPIASIIYCHILKVFPKNLAVSRIL